MYRFILVSSLKHSDSTARDIIKPSPQLVLLPSVHIGRCYRTAGYILRAALPSPWQLILWLRFLCLFSALSESPKKQWLRDCLSTADSAFPFFPTQNTRRLQPSTQLYTPSINSFTVTLLGNRDEGWGRHSEKDTAVLQPLEMADQSRCCPAKPTLISLCTVGWGSLLAEWGWEGSPWGSGDTGKELSLSSRFSCLNRMYTLSHHSPPATSVRLSRPHSRATYSQMQTFNMSKKKLSF